MILLSFALAYAGFALLALAMARHRAQAALTVRLAAGHRALLRMGGALLLLVAGGAVVLEWGWRMGPVAWFGVLSVAGLLLAFLMSFAARLALLRLPVVVAATACLWLAVR